MDNNDNKAAEDKAAEAAATNLLDKDTKPGLPDVTEPLAKVAAAGDSGPVNQGGGGNKGG